MIRLAVLDLAGTTIDEGGAVYAALAGAVAKAGADPADEAVQRWMGTDKREAIRGLVAESTGEASDAIDDELVEKLYGDFRARLAGAYRADPPQPIAGVPETLALLRAQGVNVALTTGFARDVAEPLLEGLSWTIAGGGEDGAVVVRAMGGFLTDDSAAVRLRRGLLVAMVAGVQYAPWSAAGVASAW